MKRFFLLFTLVMTMGMIAVAQELVPLDRSSLDEPPTGYVNGLFTVNEGGTQVYFSQGNLQYVDGEWRFAEHQWDILGDNGQGSTSEDAARDLFGWGTSGRAHGAVSYQPWSTSQTDSEYYAYGDKGYDLVDEDGTADWGSNGIANGGNVEGLWRVLTREEWEYLFFGRATSSGIRYAKAKVNGVKGVVVLPDDWSEEYRALNNTNTPGGRYRDNIVTLSEWESTMEPHGAVFLPAGGYRFETKVWHSGERGSYYSATSSGSYHAWNMSFDDANLYSGTSVTRRGNGMSVRLVSTSTSLWYTSVTTGEVTEITPNSATASGMVVTEGGTVLTAVGVCWSTSPDPTVEGEHTDEGVLTGDFTSALTGLERNTTYYVRAYATDGEGDTMYGEEVEFTTLPELPAVTTSTINDADIDITTAMVGGEVTDDGGTTVDECGVCWGTTAELTIEGDHVAAATPGTGTFTVALTGLTQNTTYYVCAYVTNSVGTVYGEAVSFTTLRQPWDITATAEPAEGGTVTGAQTYFQGDECKLTATANEGYAFVNWTEGVDDTGAPNVVSTDAEYTFEVTEAHDLVANFQLKSYSVAVSVDPEEGGSIYVGNDVFTGGTINHGTELALVATPSDGYAFVNWTEGVDETGAPNVVSTDATYTLEVTAAHTLVAHFELTRPQGTINGKFSVNADGDQVYFSQGNLQYIGSAATPYWKFADHQWDCFGEFGQGSGSQTVDRDLFGWGTSGYDHGAVCYQPWSTSTTDSDYWAYGDGSHNLNDETGKADWGYNAIINGGNTENQWFTLSHEEWKYVFETRTTTSGIRYAKGKVNDVSGVILLPDDWDASYYTLSNTNTYDASFSTNTISETEWATLEQHGAVFLPAAGYRYRAFVLNVGSNGYYWSASCNGSDYAWYVYFDVSNLSADHYCYRDYSQSVRLVLSPQDSSFGISATASPTEGGEVSGGGTYEAGASCTLTATPNEGYTFVNWTEGVDDTGAPRVVSTNAEYTFRVTGSRTLVAHFELIPIPEGAIKGKFSVNADGDQVYFSQGNLQYQASTNTWQFAEHQWDYVGRANANASANSSGWMDLFGWGTSGYNHGAVCYQPWSTSTTDSDYWAYGDGSYNLNDETGKADWGYNAISNGGNTENQWFTLSHEEWKYVFNTRTTTSGIRYAKATVNEVNGVILLPDDWDASYYTLSNTNTPGASFSTNTISETEWATLEQHGAVFLPAAGYRSGTSVFNVGRYGYYWSASCYGSLSAWYVYFLGSNLLTDGYSSRYYGQSVRLVLSPQNCSLGISATASPTEGGEVSGGGTYEAGASCTLTATPNEGYTFVNWTEGDKVVSTNAEYTFRVTGSRTLVAHFELTRPQGTINGKFSVNADGDQVYFSKGNLQYIGSATTPYWKFADHQWDYLGTTTNQNSQNQNVDRDLFGWGTSGYDHGAVCYQPWSTSLTDSDYWAYGDGSYNLNDETGKADWGYNAIINGGNTENQWFTLSQPEWDYVFNTRTTTSGIRYAKATVNEVNGVILLPDDWDASYYTLSNTNSGNASYSSNTIGETEWATLEQHGAVFLPAAGYRYGASVHNVGSYGYYWSASCYNSNYAWYVFFSGSLLSAGFSGGCYYGQSVRLVLSSQDSSFGISATASPTEGGEVSGGGTYEAGASCTLSATPNEGYTFVNWTEGVDDTGAPRVVSTNAEYTFRVTSSRTLVANFELAPTSPEGTINGKFSVNFEGDQVYFSKGNLQYIGSAATPYWKFADHQWDYLGTTTNQNGQNQNVDRDLFGWGTSGADHGGNCFLPWSTSTANSDYHAYGNENYSLNDQTGYADWGNNAISNGGNTENQWFTLSREEWKYVLDTRTTTSGIRYAKAKVNEVNGVILLPDDWETSYYTLSNTNTGNANYSSNTISETEWATLERHGAIFLPAAGYRFGTSVSGVNSFGLYWSASYDDSDYAWSLYYGGSFLNTESNSDRSFAFPVRLVLPLQEGPFGISVVANPSVGGTLSGARAYDFGTSCTLTATPAEGYTFVNWTEVVDDTGTPNVVSTNAEYTFRVTGSRVLVANFELAPTSPEGTINGKFSVNFEGDQVYFSKGNLQYIGSAATPYWKFADHQWDYLGTTTNQNGQNQNVDRDLFGWGTSGADHGGNCFLPWSTSTANSDYHAYGNENYSLNDQTGQADWGYNAISNGGNTENQWFTLSQAEWIYVFDTRTTTSGIRYAKGKVNDVSGVILLPDDWDASYYTLSNTNSGNASYSSNTIGETEWATLEQHGAVFLPAAGYRYGTSVGLVGSNGYYWSVSCCSSNGAWVVYFGDSDLVTGSSSYRCDGRSVRLVRSLQ